MKTIIYLFITLFTLSTLTSCGTTKTDTDNIIKHNTSKIKTEKNLIKIGVLAPLSGGASSYGKDAVNTYKKSVDDYNKQNNKTKVELIIEDSKCNGKDSISATQKLINVDKVNFILGGICSSETIAAGKIAEAKKIVMISPTSSSPEISDIGEYIYRYWNDAHAGSGLSEYLNKKYKKITLIVENTDYAKALADKLKELYTGEIALEINFDSSEKDFGIIANNIKKTKSESLILLNQTDGTVISVIKSLKDKGLIEEYGKENVIGAYFFSSDPIREGLGEEYMSGFIQVNIDSEASVVPKGIEFLEDFKKEYEVNFDASFIYLEKEAVDFMLDSIKKGVTNSEGLKKELDSITKANPRQGYFGEYYIDSKGDAVGLKYSIEKIIPGGTEKISY